MTTNTSLIPTQDAAGPGVTLITALAEAGDLSADEYRAIYDRVAEGRSLRNVELALHSAVSFGWWAGYAKGEKGLDRERKNELRRWAGLPELPPSVVEAVAPRAHPDAAVYQVGEEIANRVVLVGADVAAVNLRLNGNCTVVAADTMTPDAHQIARIAPYRRDPRGTIHLNRGAWERLNAARLQRGQTWDEFLAELEVSDAPST